MVVIHTSAPEKGLRLVPRTCAHACTRLHCGRVSPAAQCTYLRNWPRPPRSSSGCSPWRRAPASAWCQASSRPLPALSGHCTAATAATASTRVAVCARRAADRGPRAPLASCKPLKSVFRRTEPLRCRVGGLGWRLPVSTEVSLAMHEMCDVRSYVERDALHSNCVTGRQGERAF